MLTCAHSEFYSCNTQREKRPNFFFFPTGPVLKETCHRLITAGPGCVKRKPVIQSEPNPDPPTKGVCPSTLLDSVSAVTPV